MKNKIIISIVVIMIGYVLTKNYLDYDYNKDYNYLVYAFTSETFSTYEDAYNYSTIFPSSLVREESINSYIVYLAICKDNNILNNLLSYYNEENIKVYLKNIDVNKDFYNTLSNYEKVLLSTDDKNIYQKINNLVLEEYEVSYA